MNSREEFHINCNKPAQTVIDLLDNECDLSRQVLKTVLGKGCVWLEDTKGIKRIRRAKKQLRQGDMLHVYYNEKILQCTPPVSELISDEGDYSIWNKPCGMFSQGSKWGDHCTIYRWAEQNLLPQRPAFLVHRLDRAAHGLIILAHKKSVANKFATLFRQREIHKHYLARVEGHLEVTELPSRITLALDGKAASTTILETIYYPDSQQTDVKVSIETGRKHQIRRHLASLGHPITGDRLYGSHQTELDLQLGSIYLGFNCPVTAEFKEYRLPVTDQ